jgi:uncharacterized membrane protein YsdA (DUF1294 family)
MQKNHSLRATKIQYAPLKLFIFIALCALPFWGSALLWIERQLFWPTLFYAVMSLFAFGFYWSDKRRAQTDQRRISENSLHLFELLGGWPGALLAQQIFRHKTRKLPFQFLCWVIILVHQMFWLDWFLFDARYSTQVLNFLMGR